MRKSYLFVLVFVVMLCAAGYAQTEAESEDDKGTLFFSVGFQNGFFNKRSLSLLSGNINVEELSFIKAGGYWEKRQGIGNLVLGLETGFSSGGGDFYNFIPLVLSGAYTFPLADFFAIGPSAKVGALAAVDSDFFKVIPVVGARLEAELRYPSFPVSLYGAGGIDFFPGSLDILPVAEIGIRFPRGTLKGSGMRTAAVGGNGVSGSQSGAASLQSQSQAQGSGNGASGQTAGTSSGGSTQSPAGASLVPGTGASGTGPGGAGTQGGPAGTAGSQVPGEGSQAPGSGQDDAQTQPPSGTGAGGDALAGTGTQGSQSTGTPQGGQVPPAVAIPSVSSVTVTPGVTTVTPGAGQTFAASVVGTNNPAQGVTWSIVEPGKNPGTSINSAGHLTVAPGETLPSLTVRATSTADTSRSGTAVVSIPRVPSVSSVTVTPPITTVAPGAGQTFAASVIGTNNPPQSVRWSIVEPGKNPGTSINSAGRLTVAPGETLSSLTVRATSTADTSRSGTAVVTVPRVPSVSSVTVTPPATTVAPGAGQTFAASVAGNNNPPQSVTWSIVESGRNPGTSINSSGRLTVAPGETLSSLTVRATSTADTSRSGTAVVSIPRVPSVSVSSVTVTPPVTTVAPGAGQTFAASVAGNNNPPQSVRWSIVEPGKNPGTSINSAGRLTVAPGETLSSLTVRATSTADTSRSGTAVVTVPRAQSQAATPSSQAGAPALPSVRTSSTGTLVVGLGEVDFRAVYFEPDTANLIEAYRPVIDAVGEELRGDSTLRVTLQAYTAPFGTAAGRDMVSASRVNFCRDYLIQEYGIAASRIIGESYASERAPEGASGTDWVSYRCVEFIVAR